MSAPRLSRARIAAYAFLFTASGAAGLIYQVVWMRELGLLFGNTAEAASATLAAFFLGLAVGGRVFGRRAGGMSNPLRVFGLLELGVALLALGVFLILPLYESLFPALYRSSFDSPVVFLAAKLALSIVCLFPAAFLMGATLPVLGEALSSGDRTPGRAVALIYALNTIGAAAGALAAAFLLPRALGYRATGMLAIGLSAGVGVLALLGSLPVGARSRGGEAEATGRPIPRRYVILAAISGFGVLALEVLWTHLFARTLQNSVYTFGAILVVVLAALAAGAFLARVLMRSSAPRRLTVAWLCGVSGALVAVTPSWAQGVHALPWLTSGASTFGAYVLAVFIEATLVIGPATLAAGTLFPYVLHAAARRGRGTGALIGQLVFWNLTGAVVGALMAGFLAAPVLGSRIAAALVGTVYLAACLWHVPWRRPVARLLAGVAVAVVVIGVGLATLQSGLGLVPRGETLIEAYHGSAGTVTVSRRKSGSVALRLNRSYALGGSADPRWERLQAHIPLLIHPEPKSVFFIGLGTGITAGGALSHDVDRVLVAELVPEVVEAAEDHFGGLARGLFEDPRATVRVDDARSILRGTHERFDVIVGDLFLPWKRGVGNVFTKEQLSAGRARLNPGGLYAQWLPLYQLGEAELLTIARSFEAVFPLVTVWRGDFFGKRPIIALIGHESDTPLDAAAFESRFAAAGEAGWLGAEAGARSIGFQLYAGNLKAAAARMAGAPLSTDDRPWVELLAPFAERQRKYKLAKPFVGVSLLGLYNEMHKVLPPTEDPFLRNATRRQQGWVEGGTWLYEYAVHERTGRAEARRAAWRAWLLRVKADVRPDPSDWI